MQRNLRIVVEALDALGMGACVFDLSDRTLLWNSTFLHLFPEHAGKVHVGEHYSANLRRFYEQRLAPEERRNIDRFISDGVERHRSHDGAYGFAHRGVMVKVVARTIPGVGRMRIWSPEAAHLPRRDDASAFPAGLGGADIFDHMTEGLVVFTSDGSAIWANGAFAEIYRLGLGEVVLGRTFEAIYREAWSSAPEDSRGPMLDGLSRLEDFQHFEGVPIEVPLPYDRWIQVTQSMTSHGVAYATHVDVSPLKRQQARLQETQAALSRQSTRLKAVLDHMDQGVLLVGPDGIVEVGNRRVLELEGIPEGMLDGLTDFRALVAHQAASGELDSLPPALTDALGAEEGHRLAQDFDRRRPQGRIVEVRRVPVAGGGSLRTYTDVTERRLHEAQLRHVGHHDGLTQLVNRDRFRDLLEGCLQTSSRRDDGVAIHFIDLDRFKPVNDALGHEMGDLVLAEVARRLRQVARESDVVGRLGGDEFAVLQLGAAERGQAQGMAERLLAALEQPFLIEDHQIGIGASIGVALYPSGGEDAASLIKSADRAMYIAKATCSGIRLFAHGDTRDGDSTL